MSFVPPLLLVPVAVAGISSTLASRLRVDQGLTAVPVPPFFLDAVAASFRVSGDVSLVFVRGNGAGDVLTAVVGQGRTCS